VRPPPIDPGESPHSALADEDRYQPTYGKPELQKALIDERAAEATLERRIAEVEAQLASPPVPGATNPGPSDQLQVATSRCAAGSSPPWRPARPMGAGARPGSTIHRGRSIRIPSSRPHRL